MSSKEPNHIRTPNLKHIFLVYSKQTLYKGTGFLYNNKYIITNFHVIKNSSLESIFANNLEQRNLSFSKIISDKTRDLAILTLKNPLDGGFEIDDSNYAKPGRLVTTWGYPLAYNGPAPILSVGYVAGFNLEPGQKTKHLVINGAFNPGNSGGPLLSPENNKVIGVVVSKHTPTTPFLASALIALEKHQSGFQFKATDNNGNTRAFSQSQIIAEFLKHIRAQTQVMLGEAIEISELKSFLTENNIELK